MGTTGELCPPQTPRQLTRPDWARTGTRSRARSSPGLAPCSGVPVQAPSFCMGVLRGRAMPAAGANPWHVPIPWRGSVRLGRLDSAKCCSAAREAETTVWAAGEELQEPHCGLGPTALASPPTSPPHGGKGTGFRQTTRMSLSAACSCQAPQLGAHGAPRNFLPIWARHTTSCSHCASCAPGVASAPSFSTDSQGASGGLGTGSCRKHPPRRTDPHPEPLSCFHTALPVTPTACAQSPAGNPRPQLLPTPWLLQAP